MSNEAVDMNEEEHGFSYEEELLRKAEDGDVNSQYELARLLLFDEEHPERYEEGFKWAKLAAKKSSRASMLVAKCYYDGVGCNQDKRRAVKTAEKALLFQEMNNDLARGLGDFVGGCVKFLGNALTGVFSQSCEDARVFLANCYTLGEGVPRNYAKAVTLLEEAIAEGSRQAQLVLAEHYAEGKIVNQDVKKAIELSLPFVRGGSQVIEFVFNCYEQLGDPDSLIEAYMWCAILKAKEVPSYSDKLDELELALDLEQVYLAQDKAKAQWSLL
ncbi:tetratricopeptide repeat protein [Halodesulfovibrio spirochaetisodalis]|uniref:Uncharacterized protein n=1 Tax=Halodesulfovibrio spirochaetisodalis TaxID=1560234 RepID=A0A1B7XAV1_9BACT|nr:tetratricopeptide repeat protein [Halodesulfovibrio spirochaetisodalis]OBQ46466.1 hypothetical protein SP90_12230 [Halodesulfovibrio spirochaetisodalis]